MHKCLRRIHLFLSHLCLFSFEILNILEVGFVRVVAGEGVVVGEGWVLFLIF